MRAYARERLATPGPIVAASIVAIAATAIRNWRGSFLVDVMLAALLVAQFRLWDDLADREHDAADHPDRALVRAESVRPFIAALAGLTALNASVVALRWGIGGAFATFAATIAALAVWYATRRRRSLAGDHLRLAKYPAFTAVIAGGPSAIASASALAMLGCVYLAFCVYEAWHDAASPFGSRTRAVEAALLVTIALVLVLSFEGGIP